MPTKLSTEPLLARNIHWDLPIILPGQTQLPDDAQLAACGRWTVATGVPLCPLIHFAHKKETKTC